MDFDYRQYDKEETERLKKQVKKIIKVGVITFIIIFGIITLLCSFKTIKSGEVGLKIRFGKIIDSSLKEGFNFKIPYVDKIEIVNIKVKKEEIKTESSSKDMQTVWTNLVVNYRVDSNYASELYRNVGNNYQETILDPAIKEGVKSILAQYTAEEIIIKRNEISGKCLEALQEKLKKYGIVIDEFNIINLNFSDEYSKAIENKQVAEQNLAKAKLDAEAKIVEAEATKKANDLLKQSLTDELIAKQFIEKWDGKLPETFAGSDILKIFNLK